MAAAIHFGLFLFSILGNITQQQDAVKELFTEIPLGKALVIYAQYHTLVVLSYLLKLQPIIVTASLMATFCLLDKNIMVSSNRTGPLIPLLGAGLPRYRIAVPFFIAASGRNLFMCTVEEVFCAQCQNWPGADSKKFIDADNTAQKKNIPQNDDVTSIKLYGTNVDLENGTFENGKFILSSELTRSLPDVLDAGRIQWLPNTDEHPAGYVLRNIKDLKTKTWLENAEKYEFELKFSPEKTVKMPIFYTNRNEKMKWLEDGEVFIVSTIPPRNLVDLTKKNIPMSLVTICRELSASKETKPQNSLYSQFHCRVLRPLQETAFIFCVIPIILSGRIKYKLLVALYLMFFSVFYYAAVILGNSLINHYGFSPAVGAWVPIAVTALTAAILYHELYT